LGRADCGRMWSDASFLLAKKLKIVAVMKWLCLAVGAACRPAEGAEQRGLENANSVKFRG